MGLSIKKVLGYGLINAKEHLTPDEFRVICSRFGVNGWKSFEDHDGVCEKHDIVTVEDFRTRIKPRIPNIQQYIVKASGVFKDPERTLRELTPMIYTYWS